MAEQKKRTWMEFKASECENIKKWYVPDLFAFVLTLLVPGFFDLKYPKAE